MRTPEGTRRVYILPSSAPRASTPKRGEDFWLIKLVEEQRITNKKLDNISALLVDILQRLNQPTKKEGE